MENYKLFLDDIRDPSACLNYKTKFMPKDCKEYSLDNWLIARNFSEFVEILESMFASGKFPDLISFDHDLADIHYNSEMPGKSGCDEETGADCAKFLIQFCLKHDLIPPHFYIHSANPSGAERIFGNMQDYHRYKGRF